MRHREKDENVGIPTARLRQYLSLSLYEYLILVVLTEPGAGLQETVSATAAQRPIPLPVFRPPDATKERQTNAQVCARCSHARTDFPSPTGITIKQAAISPSRGVERDATVADGRKWLAFAARRLLFFCGNTHAELTLSVWVIGLSSGFQNLLALAHRDLTGTSSNRAGREAAIECRIANYSRGRRPSCRGRVDLGQEIEPACLARSTRRSPARGCRAG